MREEEKEVSKLEKQAVENMYDSLVYHFLLKLSSINYLRSMTVWLS